MERNGTKTLLLKKDKHGYYKKVTSKKYPWSDKRLVENIRNEVAFLEQENGRQLEEQEVKLVMLVNLLNYMEDSSSVEDTRHKEIKKLIDNNKLLHSKESEEKKMAEEQSINEKRLLQIDKFNTRIITLTNKEFYNGLTLNQQGKAYLIYKDNSLYLKGLKELTKAELKEVKNIDTSFLNIMFTLCFDEVFKMLKEGKDYKNTLFEINVTDLYQYIHGKRNLNKQNKAQLVSKMRSFNDLVGYIEGHGELGIFVGTKYIYETGLISFTSPYFEYLITNIYGNTIKKGIDTSKIKKFDTKNHKFWYTRKLESESLKGKNNAAKEVSNIITSMLGSCPNSKKKPHIAVKTIIERSILLQAELESSNQVTQTLKRTFTKAYKILNKSALKEEFILPSEKDVDMIPTKKNMNSLVLEFTRK